MSMKVPGLNQILSEPFVEINPEDAEELGIEDGDYVRVISKKGEIKARAITNEGIKRKTVFTTFHFPLFPVISLLKMSLTHWQRSPLLRLHLFV